MKKVTAVLLTVIILAMATVALAAPPASGTWSATASMSTARIYHTATLLPLGRVLVAGGDSSGTILNSSELYTPSWWWW